MPLVGTNFSGPSFSDPVQNPARANPVSRPAIPSVDPGQILSQVEIESWPANILGEGFWGHVFDHAEPESSPGHFMHW